ncbi:nucleotide exchange factor GrpE [Sciscionella sediminilitoris]|uniref:nucleotide exchange factor GrpE n=1 Tax=Sciscionella sediminilitoris TaxID=1445613 RepID=UPI0004DF7610|nr:nucleotide exchange factor GrpE [Sciscionella sp. SE31]
MASENQQNEDGTGPEEPRVVVRDRRKVDPETGEARAAEEATEAAETDEAAIEVEMPEAAEAGAAPQSDTAKQLEERTADLQRLQAEYANYRRRVERDREVSAVNAKAGLVAELLTVVDDIERAAQHGDLTGAFKSVADKLTGVLQQAGLESFGTENEPFDPNVHEAVQHNTSAEVEGPTVTAVLRRGYRIGEKVVRNAMVAVTDYEAPAGEEPAGSEEFAAPEQQQ